MARKTHIGEDGHIIQLGGSVRVERGLPASPDKPNTWHVYRKVDVSEDDTTTENHRWDEVDVFAEDEPGVMPEAAMALGEKLADEGE